MAKNTAVSVDQRFALLAAFGANMDWDSLTSEQVQVGIREAQRAGREATLFVQGGCRIQAGYWRETGELTLQMPALPRPDLAALRMKYEWINGIREDNSPIDELTLVLGTVLCPDEKHAGYKEYKYRRRGLPTLGYQHLEWLVEHQDEHPAFKVLVGRVYVDGPAIVVVHHNGLRAHPSLRSRAERWHLYWDNASGDLGQYGRIAAARD